MDSNFQLRMTDQNFTQRCVYRSLLGSILPTLDFLDGIEISPEERENGSFFVKNIPNFNEINDILPSSNKENNAESINMEKNPTFETSSTTVHLIFVSNSIYVYTYKEMEINKSLQNGAVNKILNFSNPRSQYLLRKPL